MNRILNPGVMGLTAMLIGACTDASTPASRFHIAGGDSKEGARLIQAYGCGTCHMIEGIRGSRGRVGPALGNYAQHTLLAGFLPNSPRYLIAWLMDPVALMPRTGMPSQGLNEAEARHIASYLYTLGAADMAAYPVDPEPPLRGERGADVEIGPLPTGNPDTTARTRRIVPNPDGTVRPPG